MAAWRAELPPETLAPLVTGAGFWGAWFDGGDSVVLKADSAVEAIRGGCGADVRKAVVLGGSAVRKPRAHRPATTRRRRRLGLFQPLQQTPARDLPARRGSRQSLRIAPPTTRPTGSPRPFLPARKIVRNHRHERTRPKHVHNKQACKCLNHWQRVRICGGDQPAIPRNCRICRALPKRHE